MKYAVIADVHANESALEAVLADARSQGAEAVVCLGDVVGYGPLPSETLARVRATCTAVAAGNHDDAVSGRGDASAFIDLAGDAVKRHREALAKDALQWLANLPYVVEMDGAIAAHGDFTAPESFRYVETEDDAAANFRSTDAQLMFVGHTHVPGVFLTGRSGRTYAIPPQDFVVEDGKRYIVNPGSVGYPRERNGECRSSYVVYDSDERSVVFRFLPFSVASVMQRGAGRRRTRRRTLAAVAAAAAIVSAGAAALLVPGRRPAAIDAAARAEIAEAARDALTIAAKTVALASGAATVHPGLRLDAKAKSPPVELTIAYLGADGAVLATDTYTVRQSKASARIPAKAKGAASARLEVRKAKEGDVPVVLAFDPH